MARAVGGGGGVVLPRVEGRGPIEAARTRGRTFCPPDAFPRLWRRGAVEPRVGQNQHTRPIPESVDGGSQDTLLGMQAQGILAALGPRTGDGGQDVATVLVVEDDPLIAQ